MRLLSSRLLYRLPDSLVASPAVGLGVKPSEMVPTEVVPTEVVLAEVVPAELLEHSVGSSDFDVESRILDDVFSLATFSSTL